MSQLPRRLAPPPATGKCGGKCNRCGKPQKDPRKVTWFTAFDGSAQFYHFACASPNQVEHIAHLNMRIVELSDLF
jgi:hypothetical protein